MDFFKTIDRIFHWDAAEIQKGLPAVGVGQVAVLRGDARGVVLQHAAEPSVTEVAAIGACLVLVSGQTGEVGEACAFEGKLHSVLVAQQVFHGVDVVVFGVVLQTEVELAADVGNLGVEDCAVAVG